MNSSYLSNNGSFNVQYVINSSNSLHKEGNLTRIVEDTEVQFIWLIYSACIIISLASLVGNSAIIHIIQKDNYMKTTTNYLILNQACCDLFITIIELISMFLPFDHVGNRWFGGLLGLITCKIFQVSVFIAPAFSIWVLVTIAIERFYAVIRPLISSPVSQHLKKTVLLLWAWSVASSTEYLVSAKVVQIGEHYYCYLPIPKWFILGTILNTLLPLLVITVLYIIVCHKLWLHKVPGEGSIQNHGQVEAKKTAKKVTVMMITIVVLYVLCWIPLDVYIILVFWEYVEINFSLYVFLVWLTVSFSALNPYIYVAFSRKFRNGFKILFGNCFCKIKVCNALSFRSQSVELEQF